MKTILFTLLTLLFAGHTYAEQEVYVTHTVIQHVTDVWIEGDTQWFESEDNNEDATFSREDLYDSQAVIHIGDKVEIALDKDDHIVEVHQFN